MVAPQRGVQMVNLEGKGSYKDSKKVSHDYVVEYEGFTRDDAGLQEAKVAYQSSGIVDILNKERATKAVNAERVALTADQRVEKDNKASVYDRVAAAQTEEEKMSILRSEGLLDD
jgi:hypothetical protein